VQGPAPNGPVFVVRGVGT